jgi:GLEYA domain
MSGIVTAIVGTNSINRIYSAGLWLIEGAAADQSPIFGSSTGISTFTRTWIGYFRPSFTGSNTLSLVTGQGATGSSTVGRLWLGPTAVTGFTDGNANIIASGNTTGSTNFDLGVGIYYPIRIRWNGTYTNFSASGSITFQANGSSNVTDRIFYNTLTNGF